MDLKIDKKDFPLSYFKSMEEDGELDPQPDYQRSYVFDDAKASKLIESVFLDIPVPSIYLNVEDDGVLSIIDGQQRVKSFLRYMKNEFALCKLTVRKDLNGKKYKELSKEEQSTIKNYSLVTYIIKDDKDNSIKYEIFERLNQGSVKLNAQELRNCVYRGSFNAMLKELAANKRITKLIQIKDNKRMDIEENLLKFFAFSNIQEFKSSQKNTLDSYMSLHRNDDESTLKKKKELILKTFDTITEVLGEEAFHGIHVKVDGTVTKSKEFSATMYDSIAIAFADFDRNLLYRNANKIKAEIDNLKLTSSIYRDLCYGASGSKDKVFGRIHMIRDLIAKIVGYDFSKEQRTFDSDIKEMLFEQQNHICPICNQEIVDIESAQIDHIEVFSKGGETKTSNAQLVHAYCNQHKNDTVVVNGFEADPSYDMLELSRFKLYANIYKLCTELCLIAKVPDGRNTSTFVTLPINAWLEVAVINKSKKIEIRLWTSNQNFEELKTIKETISESLGIECFEKNRKDYSGLCISNTDIVAEDANDAFYEKLKQQISIIFDNARSLKLNNKAEMSEESED